MSRIRLAIVLGPDPQMAAALAVALEHLESEWFHVQGLAGGAVPARAALGQWAAIPWPPGAAGLARVRRPVSQWLQAAGADLAVAWGWEALGASFQRPVVVYVRDGEPPTLLARRWESLWARRAAAVVDVGGGAPGLRMPSTRIPLMDAPSERHSEPIAGTRRLLWMGPGVSPALAAAALDGGLALEPVDRVDPAAWAGAQLAVVPLAAGAAEAPAFDAAMWSGGAVLATRVPGIVGRVRCPTQALLVDPADGAAWREALAALAADDEWQRDLARGAAEWRAATGARGQVRILQGVLAGALAVATGRCPLCPPAEEERIVRPEPRTAEES